MSSIIHPDRIANSLELAADVTIPAIIAEYAEAYRYGFDRKDRPALQAEERAAEGHKGKSGLAGDPTGDTVVEQSHVRNVLRSVGKKLDHTVKDLRAIQGRLAELFAEEEDYVPLRSISLDDDKKKHAHQDSVKAKRKREIFEEISRHQKAIVELQRELHEGAA